MGTIATEAMVQDANLTYTQLWKVKRHLLFILGRQ